MAKVVGEKRIIDPTWQAHDALDKVLEAARAISDGLERAEVLTALATLRPEGQREAIFREANEAREAAAGSEREVILPSSEIVQTVIEAASQNAESAEAYFQKWAETHLNAAKLAYEQRHSKKDIPETGTESPRPPELTEVTARWVGNGYSVVGTTYYFDDRTGRCVDEATGRCFSPIMGTVFDPPTDGGIIKPSPRPPERSSNQPYTDADAPTAASLYHRAIEVEARGNRVRALSLYALADRKADIETGERLYRRAERLEAQGDLAGAQSLYQMAFLIYRTTDGAKIPSAPHIGGQTEELLPDAIPPDEAVIKLSLKDVPESERRDLIAEIKRMAIERVKAVSRPKWDERDRYAELKDLSAPQFLKRVYSDEIGPDGSIKKTTVRKTDPSLMAIVEAYISGREARGGDMGDAKGLRFITSNAGRPKRANLG